MADSSEATLIDAMLRAVDLSGDPLKRDACVALCSKGADAFGVLSDESTREIYAFLCGVANGLAYAGINAVGLLYILQAPGVRGDLGKMREAMKQTWESIAA